MNHGTAASAGREHDLLDDWISREALARALQLSVDTLSRWQTRRVGPPCVRVGRRVLYRRKAVRKWLSEQERPGNSGWRKRE
ncbi:helix-turn-helix transcriptional regulator [Pelagibacterium sediminicola]|uniref:helix-turn-helix transcriptional regulator n=1 Tax=Pelagibacterium sediminicola TaxID=2248761 RepID=UPI000E311D35|nr:helix-turn-helix domain-containing protein [Pelagibacterium sediminicola]